MKSFVLLASALCLTVAALAQTDTTQPQKVDTIKIGGMTIIKKAGKNGNEKTITYSSNGRKRTGNLTTNWWIFDLGFANYSDKTFYPAAQQSGFVTPAITGPDNLKLRTGKSVDVNVWFFMQKFNVVKHYVNIKYGLGLELNNYHFDDNRVRLTKNPTTIGLDASLASAGKNKLAADYVTIPAMLNFDFTPGRKHGFGLSAGASIGYLYSARQKIKMDGSKTKLHDDFNLEKWKVSYIAELSLGVIRLYGSLATKSMWEKGLDQTPYTIGLRFSNF